MIRLRILRGFGVWNAGEFAGFPAERAAELIAGGFAERAEAAEAETPEAEPRPASRARRAT